MDVQIGLSKVLYRKYFSEANTMDAYKLILKSNTEYVSKSRKFTEVYENFKPSGVLKEILNSLHHPIYWLIITEAWCGDCSHSLPVFFKVAEMYPEYINCKVIYRDNHSAFMEAHLTDGKRYIPKVIQLDSNFSLTGLWGPRPNALQKLVNSWRSNEETAKQYSKLSHEWYDQDKQQAIIQDISKMLKRAIQLCPHCFK